MKNIIKMITKFLNDLATIRAATSAARLKNYDLAAKLMSSKTH